MRPRSHFLTYAVRPRVVLKYTGQLIFIAGVLNLVPAAVSLLCQEWRAATYTAGCSIFLMGGGGALARLKVTAKAQHNELLAISALSFLIVPLVTHVQYCAYQIPVVDALLEAVSALTTTGLSTLSTVEDKGFAFWFMRSWMQWYGGLGFVVVSLALLMPAPLAAGASLHSIDEAQDRLSSVRQHARITTQVYAAMTCIAIAVLVAIGIRPAYALVIALSAVSTGGFTPLDNSLESFSFFQQLTVQVIAACGAITLVAWYQSVTDKRKRLAVLSEESILYGVLLLAVFLSLVGAETLRSIESLPAVAQDSAILALSAQSTTGFAPGPITEQSDLVKAILTTSMLIGGEFGSTAGGLKLIRVLILLKVVQIFLMRIAAPPDAIIEPRLQGRTISASVIIQSAVMGTIYVITCFVIWLPFLAHGYPPIDALFESASALGTVGLSTGITAPGLPNSLKLMLCIGMFLGRLEVIAWIVLINPFSWIGQRRNSI